MADDYLRDKIQEALAASGDERHDAQKLLITWAVRDPQLLLSITKPHLKAITSSLIDHALRSKGVSKTDTGPDTFSKTAIDDLVADATTRNATDKRKNRNIPPPKSTERQATTMRKLAAAFTRKKK